MSEHPTPETDAFAVTIKSVCGSKVWVPVDIARRFERERDEARDALAAAKYYLTKERDDALSQIVQAECRAERFCQERDEARIAIIATLEENRHLADGDDCTLAKLKSVVPNWR